LNTLKNNNRKLLGIVLIVIGSMLLLDRLGIWNFRLFFPGWWTLLLIIPAIYLIITKGMQVKYMILLLIGVFFFIDERGWNFTVYMIPVALVLLGVAIVARKI